MRWIACCVLAAGIGLGLSMMLIRHFASQPSDPNLAELGLSDNLDLLTAPDEPEPIPPAVESAMATLLPPQELETRPSPSASLPKLTETQVEPMLLPVTFLDSAGTQALDDTAHRWMPRCQEPEGKSAPVNKTNAGRQADRMPSCEEVVKPSAQRSADKAR
jgi:hypothetical protein